MKTKRYPNKIDSEVGYVRGLFLKDSLAEYKKSMRALEVIRHRYHRFGRRGIYNFNGIVDNCEVPKFLLGQKVKTDRYISEVMMQEELNELAMEHLGGGEGFSTMAFNRGSAANITVVLALAKANTTVVFLVAPRGGHASISRGISLVNADCTGVVTPDEMETIVDRREVSLAVICPLYRDLMDYETFKKGLNVAKCHNIPVYVDDAGGARYRTAFRGQVKAIDLGADVVMTSTDKEGLNGPRAAIVRGRTDLMEAIGMKAAELGSEARPSVVAAIIRALREFDPANYKKLSEEYNKRAATMATKINRYLGRNVRYGTHGGDVALDSETFLEAMMEKARIDETKLSPIDASVTHAMIMLEDFGFMTVASLGKPGSTLDFRVRLNLPDAQRISNEEIVGGIIDSCDKFRCIINDFDEIKRHLFG